MSERKNVVLIMADQWRGDCLSVGGHPVVHTPYLDQLALDGVRFSRAYSATPSCIPARAGLYTGTSQRTHGRVGYQDGVPWNYATTMASEFTKHGYQTQAIGKMHVYPERSQMGFQNVILHDGYLHYARAAHVGNLEAVDDYVPWLSRELGRPADYFEHGINCNSTVARPWDKAEYLHPTSWLTTQALGFLGRRDPRKPFFLFLSFHRPHPPYDPPAWAFEQYIDTAMPEPPQGDWEGYLASFKDDYRPDALIASLTGSRLQRARAGYYGHMSHIDQQINRFLEGLADFGLAQDTAICFTSDHGEMMGDHGMYRKAYPYEGSARVPLLLKIPWSQTVKSGSVCNQLTELRDIMPTLLDTADLEVPKSVNGRSLLPLTQGQNVVWRQYLHGEHTVFGQSLHYITDERFKYIWFSETGHEQLFDLVSDPNECHDLVADPDYGDELRLARSRLLTELEGREEGYVKHGQLQTGCPVQPCHRWLCEQQTQGEG